MWTDRSPWRPPLPLPPELLPPQKVSPSTSYHTLVPQTSTYPLYTHQTASRILMNYGIYWRFHIETRNRLHCTPQSQFSLSKKKCPCSSPTALSVKPLLVSLVLMLLAHLRQNLSSSSAFSRQVGGSIHSWESVNIPFIREAAETFHSIKSLA